MSKSHGIDQSGEVRCSDHAMHAQEVHHTWSSSRGLSSGPPHMELLMRSLLYTTTHGAPHEGCPLYHHTWSSSRGLSSGPPHIELLTRAVLWTTTHAAPHEECALYHHTMTEEHGPFTRQRCSRGEGGEGEGGLATRPSSWLT